MSYETFPINTDDFNFIAEVVRIIGEEHGWKVLGLALRRCLTGEEPDWSDFKGYVSKFDRRAIEVAYLAIVHEFSPTRALASPFGEYPEV